MTYETFGIIICCDACWPRRFDEHQSAWHPWADSVAIENALEAGLGDPSFQQCGCQCQRNRTQGEV